MAYLQGTPDREGCFLCEAGAEATDDANVVWRGTHVYALLNAYPYVNGHVMVAPYAHVGDLVALEIDAALELMSATRTLLRALRAAYRPDGFNVGANLGSAAGAGFGDHLHWHIVPRWAGDTNFMTVVGQTRVVPEALGETARRLRESLAALDEPLEEPE
jgi:ATP adenylyltransferase